MPFLKYLVHCILLLLREFSYKHLAQIMYILPEAVKTDRILIHNEKTMCMEPEMKITLLFDIVKGHDEGSDYLALFVLFTSRLFDFLSANTEVSFLGRGHVQFSFLSILAEFIKM